MTTAAVAFVVVFLAELGDKTQLVAASLASRYRAGLVLGGVAVALAMTQALAALAGGAIGAALPETAVGVGAGVLFFGFAAWTWLDQDDDDELVGRTGGGLRAFAGVIVAMVVAELGDKSMLATATLAADRTPFWVWLGGTTGEVAAAGLGVLVGTVLGTRLPERTAKRVAAVLFAAFGAVLLVGTLV